MRGKGPAIPLQSPNMHGRLASSGMKAQELSVPPPQGEREDGPEAVFLERNDLLEKENQELRKEVARLKSQISSLRAHDNERKSLLWKKIQNSIDTENSLLPQQKLYAPLKSAAPAEAGSLHPRPDFGPGQERAPKSISVKEMNGEKMPPAPAPPPPPPPSKSIVGTKAVRRVPEVVELYRALTRKDASMESKTIQAGAPTVAFNRNMIGEIENRSTYLSAIKSEVERHGQYIHYLIKEVDSAAFRDISDVETFVKWLDEELSSLVDERAVLKHFPQWPERKADAMREAAFSYRDLRSLDSEVTSYQDNPEDPCERALRRMQALQDRLEGSISNVERTRESTIKRYRDFQIPWHWMLDAGVIGQMKMRSLRLGKEYMKRVAREIRQCSGNGCWREGNLLLQGVRFGYRIHQFAGGFDEETIRVFEELKKCTELCNAVAVTL